MHGPQADVVAAGLLGVAGEARLLVAPDRLGRHHEDQDSEDEDDRQPDAADAGGMPVYAADHGRTFDHTGKGSL
uniref:Uncharacterized protein n=1 Tax=Oncorhynchus mykiss TaxID=8022 RepID=A0A8C7NT59_ONCMY